VKVDALNPARDWPIGQRRFIMADETMNSERIEEILSAVPIFSRLEGRDIKRLAKLCVPRTFDVGDTVIEEGAMGLGMFVITSGRVEVFKQGDSGKVVLGAMEEGEVLGEIALIDDQPRSASAVAETRTECLLLTRDSFETLVKKEPDVAWCVVPVLAERIRELHERAVEAEERLKSAQAARVTTAPPDSSEKKAGAEDTPGAADDDDDDEETSEMQDAIAKMIRMQYGIMLGGMTGVTGMARLTETFFKKLADESEIADTDNFSDLMEKAPDSFASASRKAISDLEDLPQEMVDSFRSVYKDE
jgi:CRP-like cAMP-binding protein